MSDNYPSDVKLNENPNGTVSFATEVVATIAGLAATEVDGVASMISPSSGLADMFSRKSNRNLTKGVRIDLEDNRVSVDVTITVDYGSPIPDVARNIQENVKKAIETMSGLDVKNVDVHVTGISFEREQRANAELDEQNRKMLEKNGEAEAEAEAAPEAPESEENMVIEVKEVVPEADEDEPDDEPEDEADEPFDDDEDLEDDLEDDPDDEALEDDSDEDPDDEHREADYAQ
jgi:uncharacterized alkaline shock family protein YloU